MCMLSLKFGLSVFVFGDESVKILLVDASDAFIILLSFSVSSIIITTRLNYFTKETFL